MALCVNGTIAGRSAAVDNTWTDQLNPNAETANWHPNIFAYDMVWPISVQGQTGQSAQSVDDFCVYGRTYSNHACLNDVGGHKGNDVHGRWDTGAFVQTPGVVPVVAPISGYVEEASCASGAGGHVVIRQTNNPTTSFRFAVNHMTQPLVAGGQTVNAGQILGYLDNNDNTSCTGSSLGVHVHFEITNGPYGNQYPQNWVDPYRSLRKSYGRPGLLADGVTVDNGLAGGWNNAVARLQAGGQTWLAAQVAVGYVNSPWGPHPALTTRTNAPMTQGWVQWLSNGNTANWITSGVLTRKTSSGAGYAVVGPLYNRYMAMGLWNSYLRWPSGHQVGNVQRFEGGCLADAGAFGVLDAPTGTQPWCP